jgi:predicted RNA methylase
VDEFRHWLRKNEFEFVEGTWTFYLPPQEGISKRFASLINSYPQDAGFKVLKDFHAPDEARYANHKQSPSYGAALKRWMTPSPRSLLQVANYLFMNRLGVRVYDLVALKGDGQTLTCYVVQHIQGSDVKKEHYDTFMEKLKKVLGKGEVATIHESIELMSDFAPPDCKKNLIVNGEDGDPLYVDFQGFLLDQEKWFKGIINEVKDKVHFGRVRSFRRGKKYLYQSIPGLAVGKRDTKKRWRYYVEMLKEDNSSFNGRVVYDVGCNMGIMIYNALTEGAQWGIGWDLPDVVESAKKILLALGATRFDLVEEDISVDTDFVSKIPDRYKRKNDGILFFLAVSKHIGFPNRIKDLPWEYMFYEGHSNQDLETSIELLKHVSWLSDARIVSQGSFADGDTPERSIILLRRKMPFV